MAENSTNQATSPLKLVTTEDTWRQECDNSIVELLIEALEDAKNGKFDGLTFMATCRDGSTVTGHSKLSHSALMLAAVTRLQYRLLQI